MIKYATGDKDSTVPSITTVTVRSLLSRLGPASPNVRYKPGAWPALLPQGAALGWSGCIDFLFPFINDPADIL